MSASSPSVTTETGAQLFNRLLARPGLENIHPAIFPRGPEPNKIVQITGPNNAGKSLLIAELVVRAILPERLSPSGEFKECSAVFVNTDHHVSLIQIIKLAEVKLGLLSVPVDLHQDIIKTALGRLTVLNCYCNKQLELTFLNLEHILSQNLDIALVAIDSLSAYYWMERYEQGENVCTPSGQKSDLYSVNKHCANLLRSLKNIIDDRKIVTVFSRFESENKFHSMIDYSITLKCLMRRVGDPENDELYLLECFDHERRSKVERKYKIDTFLQFID